MAAAHWYQEEAEKFWSRVATLMQFDGDFILEVEPLAAEIELEARETLRGRFPEYLYRYNFALEWMTWLWLALETDEKTAPPSSSTFAYVTLSVQAINEVLAIRRLVESGLDVPARVVLRSLVERLFTIILLAARPQLVAEFVAAEDLDVDRRFWSKYLRPNKLLRELSKIEREINPQFPPELAEELRVWREGALNHLSKYVHPSYGASVVNYCPDVVRRPSGLPGLLGAPSTGRIIVLEETVRWIWHFALFIPEALALPRPEGMPGYVFRKDKQADQRVLVGRQVLTMLVLTHWDDLDRDLGEQELEHHGTNGLN